MSCLLILLKWDLWNGNNDIILSKDSLLITSSVNPYPNILHNFPTKYTWIHELRGCLDEEKNERKALCNQNLYFEYFSPPVFSTPKRPLSGQFFQLEAPMQSVGGSSHCLQEGEKKKPVQIAKEHNATVALHVHWLVVNIPMEKRIKMGVKYNNKFHFFSMNWHYSIPQLFLV